MASLPIALLALVVSAGAHFLLNHPATIGFIDDNEGIWPCGGFSPNFNNDTITDWHVGGDAIFTTLAHPQSNFLYRATLDLTARSNWTELFPIVQQSGLGDRCEPSVPAPASWVGMKGIIGVVADGPDGILFQCAAVSFVSGTGTPASTCVNATGVSGAFTTDPSLAALISPSSGGSATTTASPPASTSKSAAAGFVEAGTSPFGSLMVVAIMAILGAALL